MPYDISALEELIARVKASGGSEIANTQAFIDRLCAVLDLPRPEFSNERNRDNDYVFERRVTFKHPDGSTSTGRIDLYKRGCFVLESKQSSLAQARRPDADQLALLPEDAAQLKLGTARRGTGGWDRAMLAARNQAESYARALPVEHGYPPFLIVLDVGHVMEIYADFSGQGKNYAHFPDRQSYRLTMDALLDPAIQARLKAIWTDPPSLDPARRSAEVTRDIAGRLSIIARRLEAKHDPQGVAEFLMRCLFTMFAEDVGLLPKAGFAELLHELEDRPETFPPALESLWKAMDEGTYEPRLMQTLRRFNGSLFKTRTALPLAPEDIHELYVAARQDWSEVEPAIFGTLLERALDPRERSKLGAHYTPRAYVERLVIPTIIEPLRADWDEVQAHVADLHRDHKDAEALRAVKDFHHRLCTIRVLDPACGTGNFLYVALELMKRLEGEVLVALDELGEHQSRLAMEGETVGPRQFYGLELNPRAVPIADLVLWIGYLKWQLRTVGLANITEPVLNAYGTIRHQDAILAYDRKELLRDAHGAPVTRWDGVTMKRHPVTGEAVPDPEARIEIYRYINPRPAEWPEAEFIVGNPPFIGKGVDMRRELGDGYVEALAALPDGVPASADFVMWWWAKAARLVVDGRLRRFGLITTNSLRQLFNRRVIEKALTSGRVSLRFAVPDHPWLKAPDKASVRIAMTVGHRGKDEGSLGLVSSEHDLYSDAPRVTLDMQTGYINAGLTLAISFDDVEQLHANEGLASMGPAIGSRGFILPAHSTLAQKYSSTENLIRPIVNGRDLVQRNRGMFVIDAQGFESDELQATVPDLYQHLLEQVFPVRATNNDLKLRDQWWRFRRSNDDYRKMVGGLSRFIATPETAKHRLFAFLRGDILCEHGVIGFGLNLPRFLSILTTRVHVVWALATGGTLENRPRYNKTRTFDPFPFPAFADLPPDLIARLDSLGERLDAFRKERLAAHDFLTMTGLYNVLERLRELENGADVPPLDARERDIHEAGLVSVLKEIHDEIDRAVFEAYGWQDLIPALVGKPGATTPSPHKSPAQEAAEEDLLTRLVTLNRARAAEEAQGLVRWLRPDYQIPRLGNRIARPEPEQFEADIAIAAKAERPKWPADPFAQIRIVRDVLARAPAPAAPERIAAAFDGRLTEKRKARVAQVLETLAATGAARADVDAPNRYFVPR